MSFKRNLSGSYPCVWNTWKSDGVMWSIEDLPPEDDEAAMKILEENMIPDEVLCSLSGLANDPISVRSMCDFWRKCLSQRMSLACYAEVDGTKKLVGLNVCVVMKEGEDVGIEIEGESWKNVYNALHCGDEKRNAFKYLGVDTVLYALGLVIKRDFRGAKLGAKLLAAREPLSLSQSIKATSTIFTGIASQKLAASCGFETIAEVSMKELAEKGLNYPKDDPRSIKSMVKKYV